MVLEEGAQQGGISASVLGILLTGSKVHDQIRHVAFLMEDAIDGIIERVVEHRIHVPLVGVGIIGLTLRDLAHAEDARGSAKWREEVAVHVLHAVDP
jgi:hypothetical protein